MTPPKIFALVKFLLSKLHFFISVEKIFGALRAQTPVLVVPTGRFSKYPKKFGAARAELSVHRGGTPPVVSLFMTPPVRQKFMTPPLEKFPCAPMSHFIILIVHLVYVCILNMNM